MLSWNNKGKPFSVSISFSWNYTTRCHSWNHKLLFIIRRKLERAYWYQMKLICITVLKKKRKHGKGNFTWIVAIFLWSEQWLFYLHHLITPFNFNSSEAWNNTNKRKTSYKRRWQCNYVDAYKIHGNGETFYMDMIYSVNIQKQTKDTSST